MAETTIVPEKIPYEIVILILLPYFIAVIAAIIYTNRKMKEDSYNAGKNSDDKQGENEKESNKITSYFCLGQSWCPSLLFLYSLLPIQ